MSKAVSEMPLPYQLRYWASEYDIPPGLVEKAADRIEELEEKLRDIAQIARLSAEHRLTVDAAKLLETVGAISTPTPQKAEKQ